MTTKKKKPVRIHNEASAAPKQITQHFITNLGVTYRHDTLEGRPHLVVPTVAMIAGVLNGSQGPVLYKTEDMENSIGLWNHRPLIVYHPKDGESACTADVINARKVGVVLGCQVVENKMTMESWVDIGLANAIDKRIIERIENNMPSEVSTGLQADLILEAGEENGVAYKGIATNYRPDHLAILPDQLGACTVAQGAGLLQNKAKDPAAKLTDIERSQLAELGHFTPILNERSYESVTSDLYTLLRARFGYNAYIEAVFDSYFIYCVDEKSWKLNYKSNDQETSIDADPVHVYRSVTYVTANGSNPLVTVTNSQAKEPTAMKKSEMIQRLIANAESGFTEEDKAFLEKKSEEQLTKLMGKEPVVENAEGKPPVPKPGDVTQVQNKGETDADALKKLPVSVQRMVANAERIENAEKDRLVAIILGNEANEFTDVYLKTLDVNQLAGIARIAAQNSNAPQAQSNTVPMFNMGGAFTLPGTQLQNRGGVEEEALSTPSIDWSK